MSIELASVDPSVSEPTTISAFSLSPLSIHSPIQLPGPAPPFFFYFFILSLFSCFASSWCLLIQPRVCPRCRLPLSLTCPQSTEHHPGFLLLHSIFSPILFFSGASSSTHSCYCDFLRHQVLLLALLPAPLPDASFSGHAPPPASLLPLLVRLQLPAASSGLGPARHNS